MKWMILNLALIVLSLIVFPHFDSPLGITSFIMGCAAASLGAVAIILRLRKPKDTKRS